MTIIKTNDFILRPLSIDDAESYFEVMQDEDTKKNLQSVPSTLEEAKKEIKEYLIQVKEKDSEYFTIEIDKAYAGNVILQHQNWDLNSDEGRIHIWIHPKFRGKGLATKAITEVMNYGLKNKFKRIFIQCNSKNQGINKINSKLNLKKVKTFVNDNGSEKNLWVKENSDNDIQIRLFQEKDTEELSKLIQKTLYEINIKDSPEFAIKELRDEYHPKELIKLSKERDIYVAIENNEIIGSVANKDNFICTLFVKHDLINKGIGTKLLKFIENKIKKLNYDKSELVSSLTAENFFKKLGYTETKKQYQYDKLTGIFMIKKL